MEWTIIVNLILVFIPIIIGGALRKKKEIDVKYFKAGSIIQLSAIVAAAVLFTGDFLKETKGFIVLYVAYGITFVIYLFSFLYSYLRVIKK